MPLKSRSTQQAFFLNIEYVETIVIWKSKREKSKVYFNWKTGMCKKCLFLVQLSVFIHIRKQQANPIVLHWQLSLANL